MGLSASQARLLSITARLSDNELHSQQIANAKIRLADQTQEASREYVNSLDAQKLMYTMYDAKGNSTQVNFTPAVMYEFAEMKNQYGISNSAGQLLISSTDATHYKNSQNLTEFLQSYGVEMIHNEEYDNYLDIIYSEHPELYNSESLANDENTVMQALKTLKTDYADLEIPAISMNESTQEYYDGYWNSIKEQIDDINDTYKLAVAGTSLINNIRTDINDGDSQDSYGSMFTSYIESLYSIPALEITEPVLSTPWLDEEPDVATYAENILNPICWKATGIVQLFQNKTLDEIVAEFRNTNDYINAIAKYEADHKTVMTDDQKDAYVRGSIIDHIEHVLAQYLWSDGFGEEETIETQYGVITNNAGPSSSELYWGIGAGGYKIHSLAKDIENNVYASEEAARAAYNNHLYWYTTGEDGHKVFSDEMPTPTREDVDPKNIHGTLAKPENAELKEKLQELYYQVLLYIDNTENTFYASKKGDGVLWDGSFTNYTKTPWSAEDITSMYADLIGKLANAAALDSTIYKTAVTNYQNTQQYKKDCATYAQEIPTYLKYVEGWTKSVEYLKEMYHNLLSNMPESEIVDETDPKVAWYTNLWHRINGPSDQNVNTKLNARNELVLDTEATSSVRWKILDDESLKSSAWLQFALEQGLVTLEQVQFVDPAESGTGLANAKWQSKIFTTCPDIQFVDDETAIARAEAEYTRKLNEIEAKDKKYDNDIKKLDTEHNALQTEYESVKSVVDKNIERSFKAFS